MAQKRLGYNWKARQHVKKLRKHSTRETDFTDKNEEEDTNYEVIPENQIEINTEKREHKSGIKRRKLSARERKSLQRDVEIKRKESQASQPYLRHTPTWLVGQGYFCCYILAHT